MNKRPEITTQTKQNIIDAFWMIYGEKRIEQITIKEITNKAGYNRGTFYEYFTDVYDVLNHIEISLIPTINELPPITIATGTMGMPLELFLGLFEQNKKYYSVLLGENGDPAFAIKLKKSIKPIIMHELVSKQNVEPKELDIILEYQLSAMIGVLSYWLKQPDPLAKDSLIEIIHRLMEQGVLKQLQLC